MGGVFLSVGGGGLIRLGIGGRYGRGGRGDRRWCRGPVAWRGRIRVHADWHDDHLSAAAVAEAQGFERLLHADGTQSKSPRSLTEIVAGLATSVSASRLSLFYGCRLRFYFRHVLGLTRPNAASLHLGAVVHQTLRAWNRARWQRQERSFGSMYSAYEEAWILGQADEPVVWDDPDEQEAQKQVGWRLLETFFRETSLLITGKPKAVEVQVEADLCSHGLPRLVGVLDLVQDGRVIDFKTVGQTPTPERAALLNTIQVTAYSLLYRENTGQRERAVELHHLVKLKQPKLVVIELPPVTDAQNTRLYRLIESYVRGLERQDLRELVLDAYDGRCAVSGLPERQLLHAAHILPDRDERGLPVIGNGIAMSTLHHAAYDANLLGIDPDGGIHVNEGLLRIHDGPTLEYALKGVHGARLRQPNSSVDQPNRDFLAARYEQFVNAV